ncbi:hypothetical protein HanIR_Chr14g0701441 [Helianthus annuus]|nr:hypothetical protein HanIR_Chr14g0701441 [Helianthus annuus]
MEHLFCSCYDVAALWGHICNWCRIPNFFIFSFKDLIEVHEHVGLREQQKEVLKGMVRIGFCSLWRGRNGLRFNNNPMKIENIIAETKSVGFLWYKRRSKNRNTKWEDWCKFVNM